MPPRTPPIADRLQRLEDKLAAFTEETHELRLFCLDIHPDYSKRIVTTMQEMEQKVFLNVSAFEKQVGDINKTVRTLVAKSASDCLELVQSSISGKMAGLDSRMIGLNKKQVELDQELSQTLKRLNEFSESIEKFLEEANVQAMSSLTSQLHEAVSTGVKAQLVQLLPLLPPSSAHMTSCASASQLSDILSVPSTISSIAPLPRGRSREKFALLQNNLVLRARSVSPEGELRNVIRDARAIAACSRVDVSVDENEILR